MEKSTSPKYTSQEAAAVRHTRTSRVGKAKPSLHNCHCGRTYTRADHLRRHQKNHAQDPICCDYPGCGKPYFQIEHLRKHQQRRHGRSAPEPEAHVHALATLPVPAVSTRSPPMPYYPLAATGYVGCTYAKTSAAPLYRIIPGRTRTSSDGFCTMPWSPTISMQSPLHIHRFPRSVPYNELTHIPPSARTANSEGMAHGNSSLTYPPVPSDSGYQSSLGTGTGSSRSVPYNKLTHIPPSARTANSEGMVHGNSSLTYPPVSSDSGYQSGLGTDTGSSRSTLQEFITFFGDTLIETTGARQWAGYALAHHSQEDIEMQLDELLEKYAIDLWNNATGHAQASKESNRVFVGSVDLIRRYRSQIARYFYGNAVSVSVSAASLSARLQDLGHQLSLTERPSLFVTPDLEAEGEDGELLAGLGPVRDSLVSSDAFRRLASALRQSLYHNDMHGMQAIERAVLEGDQRLQLDSQSSSENLAAGASFESDWAIVNYMRSQYGESFPHVGSVVVITGSALYAQATTCADYITSTWPKTGSFFLELLDTALQKANAGAVKVEKACNRLSLSIKIEMDLCGKFTLFVEKTQLALLVELAQQVAWIGSALSSSPFGDQLAYARPFIHKTSSSTSEFRITFEHKSLRATETACWLVLFCGAAIASGFPIPKRGDEMGLEIPLSLLAGIAGVRHAVEHKGGVVLKSFSHVFIPVRKKEDRVQWHAISSGNPESRLTYRDALSRGDPRASCWEVSLDDLKSCRAILGWCSIAVSRLGSDSACYENIDYSGANDAESAIKLAGGSLGFQQFGMAALDFKFGAKDGTCHFQRSGPYRRIVSAAEKTPIALYDTGERRAWLVPASSIMLHMAQHRHWLEPFEVNGKCIQLDTNVPVDSSAKSVLLRNEMLRLSDAGDYTFKDVVLNIWSLLEFLIDQNVERVRNAFGTSIKGTLRESLQGFEYKAVVEERSPFRQKEVPLNKSNGGWLQLVRDIDALVLLANGFEDLILPASEGNTGLCRRWRRVPKGHDYLATSTGTLKELYDVAGCRLSRKFLTSTQLQWHQDNSTLFEACSMPNNARCRCNRLQQIYPKSNIRKIQPPSHIVDRGAVIFGHSRSLLQGPGYKPHGKAPTASSIYSQPNMPLTPLNIGNDYKNLTFSDGGVSGQSGSDAAPESIPGSLSSCTTISTQDTALEAHELVSSTKSTLCSRKRIRLPETCIQSADEEGEYEQSLTFVRKRTKSVPILHSATPTSLQCYPENYEKVDHQRVTHSDFVMQVKGQSLSSEKELSGAATMICLVEHPLPKA